MNARLGASRETHATRVLPADIESPPRVIEVKAFGTADR